MSAFEDNLGVGANESTAVRAIYYHVPSGHFHSTNLLDDGFINYHAVRVSMKHRFYI